MNFAKFFRAPFFYRTLKGAASISNCVNSKTGLHRYFGDKKKFVIENFECISNVNLMFVEHCNCFKVEAETQVLRKTL